MTYQTLCRRVPRSKLLFIRDAHPGAAPAVFVLPLSHDTQKAEIRRV